MLKKWGTSCVASIPAGFFVLPACYPHSVNFAQLLFPDFSLILIGYLICRFTPLNRPVWSQVEQLVYFLFFPVLLFHSIVKSPLDLGAASNLVGAGWALAVLVISKAAAAKAKEITVFFMVFS